MSSHFREKNHSHRNREVCESLTSGMQQHGLVLVDPTSTRIVRAAPFGDLDLADSARLTYIAQTGMAWTSLLTMYGVSV